MGRQAGRIIFSIFLIAMGVLALLSNLKILPFNLEGNQVFWLVAFGGAALAFLAVFLSDIKNNWWAVIPGFTLLGLAALISFGEALGTWGGALFLGMIGLSFWVIFLVKREFWWAVIPGGVLVTLAGVTLFAEQDGMLSGGMFFLGLALTFLLVYLLPVAGGRMTWALWPAGILGLMGALIMSGASGAAQFVWPAALILLGGFLVFRAWRRPREQ